MNIKEAIKFLKSALSVGAAIFITGVVLDELGKGTLGSIPKTIAKKVTRGYGV